MMISQNGKMSRSDSGKLGAIASREIVQEAYEKRIAEYDKEPQRCKQCSLPIPYIKRTNDFCSHVCAAVFHHLLRGQDSTPKTIRDCLECGKKTKNKKFCCQQCSATYKRHLIHEEIRKGNYKNTMSGCRTLKSFLVIERGEKCGCCGLSKWRGKPIPLDVHHKDGDASNNRPDNLELLCLNCHGITPNFGRKNKHSTRIYRYKKDGAPVRSRTGTSDLPSQTAAAAQGRIQGDKIEERF